jgi:transposase
MFVRVKSNPRSPRKSVQIVESKRIDEKVKQKVVQHIGIAADEAELEELKLLANSIKAKLELDGTLPLYDPQDLETTKSCTQKVAKKNKIEDQVENREDYDVNLLDLIEEDRIIKGIHDIYGKMYDDMNFKSVLPNPSRNVAISKALKEIVLARIANPDSKRASVDMLASKFGSFVDLKTVYRMMDAISDDRIIKLNKLVLNHTKDLLNNTIDIVYFDATTLYFESFNEDSGEDAIKKNGYSKDGKFNQPQVVLALLVTKQGLPVGYKAFSGDTFFQTTLRDSVSLHDGHTLIPAIQEIKDELQGVSLDKIVYVADSGMFNKINLQTLDEYKLDYIVGARIKNVSNDIKKQILDMQSYEEFDDDKKIKTIDYNGKKLVVTYSAKRAKKDKHDRLKAIDKLKKRLESSKSVKSQLSNNGYKKYLQLHSPSNDNKECDLSITLNEEKIQEDEVWDGLKGILTNNTTLSNEELIHQYSNLWQVEESFRITKHDLKIRPIYHWKPNRVKAHLAISFIAYTLVRHLEYKIKLLYKKLSPEKIKQLLLSVQCSILYDTKTNNKYSMPSHLDNEQKKIYKIMGVTPQLKAQKL